MAINFFLTDAGRNALNKAGDVASFGGELTHLAVEIGRASCRERVCQYV